MKTDTQGEHHVMTESQTRVRQLPAKSAMGSRPPPDASRFRRKDFVGRQWVLLGQWLADKCIVSAKGEGGPYTPASECPLARWGPEQWQVAAQPPHLLSDEPPAPQNCGTRDAGLMTPDTRPVPDRAVGGHGAGLRSGFPPSPCVSFCPPLPPPPFPPACSPDSPHSPLLQAAVSMSGREEC